MSDPLDTLAPRHRAAAAELVTRLETVRLGEGDGLCAILPELRAFLGADTATTYALRAEEQGFAMERLEVVGELPSGFLEQHRRNLRAGPRDVLLYDPARPDPAQRNRAISIRRERLPSGLAEFRAARGMQQLRVLLCDGPGLLAWVGGFADRPFEALERRLLDAVAPALLRRAQVDRVLREGEAAAHLLEAALDRIGAPAFVLRGGRVVHSNAAAQARLEADRRGTLDALAATARAGSDGAYEITRHRAPGMPEHLLAIAREVPDVEARLAVAARRWALTARQAEVLHHIATGLGNKGIAAALRCTEKNVEFHVSRLLRRAGCAGRAELLARFWSR